MTKRIIKVESYFFKGEYEESHTEINHSSIGMDAQGDLIDVGVDSRSLIDKGSVSDRLLVPDGIVIGTSLEDQPGLRQWRRQLESLGVAMLTGGSYEPFEIVKKT